MPSPKKLTKVVCTTCKGRGCIGNCKFKTQDVKDSRESATVRSESKSKHSES